VKTQFNILTHQNFHTARPVSGDAHVINYSKLKTIAFEQAFRGFSIKFVLNGCENYTVNGRAHQVQAGEYLLTNPYCQGRGYIDSQSMVEGICIDIQPAVMAEVVASLSQPGNPQVFADVKTVLESGDFYENRYRAGETGLGRFLGSMSSYVVDGRLDPATLDPALFYQLAELYIGDYQHVFRQVSAIPALKPDTRHDLYRRVMRGRDYIEAMYTKPIEMPEVARNAQLSEYHFYRLFRAVFGTSPHQYMLQKRLELGRSLLLSGHCSVTEAARQTGFADIHSFSKSFRKKFGAPPSGLLRNTPKSPL